jgi:hypothetical protein
MQKGLVKIDLILKDLWNVDNVGHIKLKNVAHIWNILVHKIQCKGFTSTLDMTIFF